MARFDITFTFACNTCKEHNYKMRNNLRVALPANVGEYESTLRQETYDSLAELLRHWIKHQHHEVDIKENTDG